jgi:hypothetical protein
LQRKKRPSKGETRAAVDVAKMALIKGKKRASMKKRYSRIFSPF